MTDARGRWRGRGGTTRGNAEHNGEHAKHNARPKRNIMDDLQPNAVQVISRPQGSTNQKNAAIADVQYLASYSWIDATKPTVIVPGETERYLIAAGDELMSLPPCRIASHLVQPSVSIDSPA